MNSLDERTIARVHQICMCLRLHLKQAQFIVVGLVADPAKRESGGESQEGCGSARECEPRCIVANVGHESVQR